MKILILKDILTKKWGLLLKILKKQYNINSEINFALQKTIIIQKTIILQ